MDWLMRGSRGEAVERLQRDLNRRLRPPPDLAVDGIFGANTQRAVRDFQRSRSLKVDGIVGPKTWAALEAEAGGGSAGGSAGTASASGAAGTAGAGAGNVGGSGASPQGGIHGGTASGLAGFVPPGGDLALVKELKRRVRRDWDERVPRPGVAGVPGGVPTRFEKERVEALLDAWARNVSDRYFERRNVMRFRDLYDNWGPEGDEDIGDAKRRVYQEAYRKIKQNFPSGCVMFVRNELDDELDPRSAAELPLNEYFSRLLAWDNYHCYGSYMELKRRTGHLQMGGGSSVHPYWLAVWQWMHEMGNKPGIYKRGVYDSWGLENMGPVSDTVFADDIGDFFGF